MEKEKNHFRVPVSDTFRRKTPFHQLHDHMIVVKKSIDALNIGLMHYYKGNYKGFSKLATMIADYEKEADIIKGNIRNHLPNTLFMPVDKGKFLRALHQQDAILDHANNLVQMLDLRHTKIPESLQKGFIEHAKSSLKTVEAMEKAVGNMMDLIETSFVKRERDQTKEYIREVQRLEHETDQLKYKVTKSIYKMESKLKPMDTYHLLKILDWVDDIADHAENVADWLRSMIAR